MLVTSRYILRPADLLARRRFGVLVLLAAYSQRMDARSSPITDLIEIWQSDPESRIVHVERQPDRSARYSVLKEPLSEVIVERLASAGIEQLFSHQARAIDRVRSGKHTVIVAGTASGKSLSYQVPLAELASLDAGNTALLLYPTKALAQDQLRAIHAFDFPHLTPASYDGDTDPDQRRWVKRHANAVLTNPDMLHVGILPNHSGWATFMARLQLVVIDEMHTFRGIFGSHFALVLRRLRRIATHYGADPTFVFTSATIGNPAALARALCGVDVEVVESDGAPRGAKSFVLWNPPLSDDDGARRVSALGEATDVLLDLIRAKIKTIAFARSRKGTELMYRWVRERLDPDMADLVAAYRGGYLPRERRAIENSLFAGDLAAVITTNALELGIDVGGLDAAVMSTYPGTISSFRQQAGRAGRTRDMSLAVLVAGQDALDQYFMAHPEELFVRAPEDGVVNPDNPEILASHVGCAAYELPLSPEDRSFLGSDTEETAAALVQRDRLRVRDGSLFWKSRKPPAPDVNIRTSGGSPYRVINSDSNSLLGTIDEGSAFMQTHPGAIYLHQGETYVVERLDLSLREAWVRQEAVDYYTQPKEEKWIDVAKELERKAVGDFQVGVGRVEVESHVIAFQRKAIRTREVLGYEALDLPPRRFETQAFSVAVPVELIARSRIRNEDLPGTLHAAEHAAIGMMPLFAICDRWDIGGMSTPFHPDLGGPGWFIYDGYPGGAGIAPVGYRRVEELLRATADLIAQCPCETGCPSCVQSPKCGNYNDPLDKKGALSLLRAGLGAGRT